MKLLVVDTDHHLVKELTACLRKSGYEVYQADTGEQAKIMWEEHYPDIVILNTALKDVDAVAMWSEMRKRHDALVVVLTDGKDVQDEIRCLESGADDYVRKPILPTQLLARIHAVIRRAHSRLAQYSSSIITIGLIRVNLVSNEFSIDGKAIHLSPTEGKLLHLLAMHANTACTISQIASYIQGSGNDKASSLVKVYIRRLRQKIEPDPGNPCYILTIPGVGYTLASRTVGRQSSGKAPLTGGDF
jgi:DNA-binding response OmpR family regulator